MLRAWGRGVGIWELGWAGGTQSGLCQCGRPMRLGLAEARCGPPRAAPQVRSTMPRHPQEARATAMQLTGMRRSSRLQARGRGRQQEGSGADGRLLHAPMPQHRLSALAPGALLQHSQ